MENNNNTNFHRRGGYSNRGGHSGERGRYRNRGGHNRGRGHYHGENEKRNNNHRTDDTSRSQPYHHENFHHPNNYQNRFSNRNISHNNLDFQLQHVELPQILNKKYLHSSGPKLSKYIWPSKIIYFVDFFLNVRVPIEFIDSNDPSLQIHINKHNRDLVVVDLQWTDTVQILLFVICSQKGVLLIYNSGPNECICNFIKSRTIYTKGQTNVEKIKNYVNSDQLKLIDIESEYISHKNLSNDLYSLAQTYVGVPNHNFQNQSSTIPNLNANSISCLYVLNSAFKSVVEYMIIPILQSDGTNKVKLSNFKLSSCETDFKSKFNIIPFKINPDLYVKFSHKALECILKLQNCGFVIPEAQDFDIDNLYKISCRRNYNEQFINDIKKLFDSFKKVNLKEIISNILDTDISPNDYEFYTKINDLDYNDLSEKDIQTLFKKFGKKFRTRNHLLEKMAAIKYKNINEESNSIINELLITIQPSDELIERIDNFFASIKFDEERFLQSMDKIINLIQKVDKNGRNFAHPNENNLLTLCKQTINQFSSFSSNTSKCSKQIHAIQKALKNLKYYRYRYALRPNEILFIDSSIKMFNAISTYCTFIDNHQDEKIRNIENLLFNLVFTPSDNQSPITNIYPVYELHDQFLNNPDPFVNFKSSTGSGKTRCAPFFFAMKALMDDMKRPFFIMTQPGRSIIQDKVKDFRDIMSHSVVLVFNVNKMIELYKEEKHEKPIVALFSPYNVLRLLEMAKNEGIDIFTRTRFCLDEIHERSVYTDILIGKLSCEMNKMTNFPLQLLMMSATPDSRVLNCFKSVKLLELQDSQLFPVYTNEIEIDNMNDIPKEAANQTYTILQQMATKTKELGHILIFTSGNSRINEIEREIDNLFD